MGHHTFWGFCLWACLAATSLVEGQPKLLGRAQCPEEAIYFRQYCYQLVDWPLAWEDAEIECQFLRRGGHLASCRSAAEERIFSALIRRATSATDVWIGMHDAQVGEKCIWEWSDGTTYTPGTPLWDGRTPSDAANCSRAGCISITNLQGPKRSIRWIQCSCATLLPFVCKYRASF